MPEIRAFRGLRYNPASAGDMAGLICPPYDVIPPSMQQELYGSSPYNAIRLELPMEADPYGAAAERLEQWIREGVLQQEGEPALYPCFQTYTGPDGNTRTRKGFFCALRLHEFSEKKVLPHERTLSGPKADRLNLFRRTKANISSIFGLYADERLGADTLIDSFSSAHAPVVDAVFQGVRNRLWKISDPALIEQVCQVLLDRQVFIADGHHRYETGVAYRNERKDADPLHNGTEPYNYILAYLTNIHDEGLLIFPIHRLVRDVEGFDPVLFRSELGKFFDVTELSGREALGDYLDREPSSATYGVVMPGIVLGMTLRGSPAEVLSQPVPPALQKLGVVVLHDLVLGQLLGISLDAMAKQTNLVYVKDDREVFDAVASGTVQAGIVVKATRVGEVLAVSGSGEVMPQKSTYFYPKIMTGLVFHSLDRPA